MGFVRKRKIGISNPTQGKHIVKLRLNKNIIKKVNEYIEELSRPKLRAAAAAETTVVESDSTIPLYIFDKLIGIRIPMKCPLIIPQIWSELGTQVDVYEYNTTLEWITVSNKNPYIRLGNLNTIINKDSIGDYYPSDMIFLGTKNTIIPDDVIGICSGALLTSVSKIDIPANVKILGNLSLNAERIDVPSLEWLFDLETPPYSGYYSGDSMINVSPFKLYINNLEIVNLEVPTTVEYKEDENKYFFNFSNCESIKSITTHVPGQFYNMPNLESVTIRDGAEIVGSFSGCPKLETIIIPSGVKTIGKFENCTALESINLPNSVNSISNYAFSGCTNLKSISIPNGVTLLKHRTFYGCTSLLSVTFGSGLKVIDMSAFEGCTSLTSIVIPEGVTEIGDRAFYGCTNLLNITIPDSVTTIGYKAFEGCMLPEAEDGIVYIGNHAIKVTDKTLSSYTLKSGTVSIGAYLFLECTHLTSFTIPNTVSIIPLYTFLGCTNLTDITIPSSVTYIDFGAFLNCKALTTNITIPNLEVLGLSTFYGCKALTSITLPSTLKKINLLAFLGCVGLTSITVPEGVTSIDLYAFRGCSGLTTISLPSTLTYIGYLAFSNCGSLTSITVPDSVESLLEEAFINCSNLATVNMSNTLIPGARAFKGTSYYNSLPDGEIIYNGVLTEYKGTLPETITISNSVTRINSKAFYTDYNLTSVPVKNIIVPDSVTYLESHAFFFYYGSINYTFNSTTPPECQYSQSTPIYKGKGTFNIYVPENSIDDYKSAPGWNTIKEYIYPIE